MSRQATVLVSDELTSTLTGKLHLLGIYTGDIVISANPTPVAQLIFLFIMESDPDDPFMAIELRVELPGGAATGLRVPVESFLLSDSDKIRWSLRFPVLLQNAMLQPGKINAIVIHDKGRIVTAAPSVIFRPPVPTPPPQSTH
jgi:hypothetical protein